MEPWSSPSHTARTVHTPPSRDRKPGATTGGERRSAAAAVPKQDSPRKTKVLFGKAAPTTAPYPSIVHLQGSGPGRDRPRGLPPDG